MQALEINHVHVTYPVSGRATPALNNLSFAVDRGTVFGFLGPNGAGKTTTIKAILQLLRPDRGEISIFGVPAAQPAARRRVGYMPEIAYYYGYVTPRELLMFYAGICGMNRAAARKKTAALLEFTGLTADADRVMAGFSKGMMQKVSVAQALINDPDLLILDEPTSGLDPLARIEIRDMISRLKQEGKTVFFSSHELSEVELVSDAIAILNRGELVTTALREDIVRQKGETRSLEQFFLSMIKERG